MASEQLIFQTCIKPLHKAPLRSRVVCSGSMQNSVANRPTPSNLQNAFFCKARLCLLSQSAAKRLAGCCGQPAGAAGFELASVCFRGVADQLGPIHIIDRAGLGPTVVFEDFDHESRIV